MNYKIIFKNPFFEIIAVENATQGHPMHLHRKLCILKIDRGSRQLCINGDYITLKKGDTCIIPAYRAHSCQMAMDETVSYSVLCITDVERMNQELLSNEKFNEIIAQNGFGLILENPIAVPSNNHNINNHKIGKILELIDENYGDALQTTWLAAQVSLNPYHLLHTFKAVVGISLHQYIIQTRIKKFQEKAFQNTDFSDLTYSCGFYDQSHLIRNFKKHTGITPRQYLQAIAR